MMNEPAADPICFAHRGASGHEPENTLRAVRKALTLGAPWIEVDVYAVAGEVLVFHDETLERTTNGAGRLLEQPLDYLRSLDAGKGEQIPFLNEVLDQIAAAGINIELKGPATAHPVTDLIAEYVGRRGWTHDRFLVSSFDLAELRRAKELLPELPVGPLVADPSLPYIRWAVEMGAYSIHLARRHVGERFVADAHAAGLKVFVFTVNDAAGIDAIRRLGVDGVFTDFPELLAPGSRR